MRRLLMGHLVLLAAIIALSGTGRYARAADLPYEGSWKVTVLDNVQEISVWLVKIDKEGKKVRVASGLPGYKDNKVSGVKADEKSIGFELTGPRQQFVLHAYIPKGKDKPETLLGTVRLGYNFIPVRLEKTELTEIDQKTAVRQTGGLADLQAALKTPDAEDKIKDLEDIMKTYEGKLITFITGNIMIAELTKKKAPAADFKPVITSYLKSATPYGREMQMQANLNLSRMLLGYDKTAALALASADKAAKLLDKDDNRGVKLMVYINQANALQKNDKADDIKKVLTNIHEIAEDVIKNPRIKVPPIVPTQEMARMLLGSQADAVADAGLEYARKAVKMLTEESSLNDQIGVYKLLRGALMLRKKTDEANKLTARIEKMEEDLDKAYLKDAIPFKPEKFAGRKGKSNRVVVVEVFTGAQCPPCVAADIAFDAVGKAYTPKDVVLLQYHLHIPGPDPMVNPDTEARAKYYDDINSTPQMFVDGKNVPKVGGAKMHAESRYELLSKQINTALETESEAKIKLKATRDGDKIAVSADVSDLKETGSQIRLYFLLVEEKVRYVGGNRLRLHHHVVRAMPGGSDGFKMEKKSSTQKASVDLTALRKKLNGYLNAYSQKTRANLPDRPMAMKDLKVVALIQDEDTKKIFQAAQVAVPAGNGGKAGKDEDKEEKKEKDEKKKKEDD